MTRLELFIVRAIFLPLALFGLVSTALGLIFTIRNVVLVVIGN